MGVKTREEILEAIKSKIGEDTSDDSISLLEDITDTIDDYETRVADKTDWKNKYDELDATWRRKYIERFSGKSGEGIKNEQEEQNKDDDDEPRTFDELFTEREG